MKIYTLKHPDGEKEWITGITLIHALKSYLKMSVQQTIEEMEDGTEIEELPREEWASHTVINPDYDPDDPDDWEKQSFEEAVNGYSYPTIIASTLID